MAECHRLCDSSADQYTFGLRPTVPNRIEMLRILSVEIRNVCGMKPNEYVMSGSEGGGCGRRVRTRSHSKRVRLVITGDGNNRVVHSDMQDRKFPSMRK